MSVSIIRGILIMLVTLLIISSIITQLGKMQGINNYTRCISVMIKAGNKAISHKECKFYLK